MRARSTAASVCPARRSTPAFFGNQRKEVPRADEIARLAGRIEDGQDRGGPLLGRNARPQR